MVQQQQQQQHDMSLSPAPTVSMVPMVEADAIRQVADMVKVLAHRIDGLQLTVSRGLESLDAKVCHPLSLSLFLCSPSRSLSVCLTQLTLRCTHHVP